MSWAWGGGGKAFFGGGFLMSPVSSTWVSVKAKWILGTQAKFGSLKLNSACVNPVLKNKTKQRIA